MSSLQAACTWSSCNIQQGSTDALLQVTLIPKTQNLSLWLAHVGITGLRRHAVSELEAAQLRSNSSCCTLVSLQWRQIKLGHTWVCSSMATT